MPTNKHRVAGYLSDDIHDLFQSLRIEKGLSESKALSHILSEYFGVTQKVSQKVSCSEVSREEFEELQQKVNHLAELLGNKKPKKKQGKSKVQLDLGIEPEG